MARQPNIFRDCVPSEGDPVPKQNVGWIGSGQVKPILHMSYDMVLLNKFNRSATDICYMNVCSGSYYCP